MLIRRPIFVRAAVALVLIGLPWEMCWAQDPVETDPVVKRVEFFFDNLKRPTVAARDAFDELLVDSLLPEDQPEQLARLLEEYDKLEQRYGPFLEAQQVQIKLVGNDVLFLTYLYKTKRFPVVWRFVYYRPPPSTPEEKTDWSVIRLSFDTKVEDLSSLPSRGL